MLMLGVHKVTTGVWRVNYAFLCIILTVWNSVANCAVVERCVHCVVVVGNRLFVLVNTVSRH